METNGNVMDAWVTAQKNAVNQIVDGTKKWQEAINGNSTSATPDASASNSSPTDAYTTWLKGQQQQIESAFKLNNPANFFNTTNGQNQNPFAFWQNTQAPANPLQNFMPQGNPFSAGNNNWFQNFSQINDLTSNWQKFFQNYYTTQSGYFNQFRNMDTNSFGAKGLEQLADTAKVYTQMFNVYQPLYQQYQQMVSEGTKPNADFMGQVFNNTAFKDAIDKIFNFNASDAQQQMAQQLQQMMGGYMQAAQQMQAQAQTQFEAFQKTFDSASNSNLLDMQKQLLAQLQQGGHAAFNLFPEGKEKEQLNQLSDIAEAMKNFFNKNAEMQAQIYKASYSAIQKLATDVAANGTSKEFPQYNEFFNMWVNNTENQLIDLFKTEDYATLQADLVASGLEIKTLSDKMLTQALSSLPIVPRQEADEMAKEIHSLKARLRQLEDASNSVLVNELVTEAKEVTPKKTATKAL